MGKLNILSNFFQGYFADSVRLNVGEPLIVALILSIIFTAVSLLGALAISRNRFLHKVLHNRLSPHFDYFILLFGEWLARHHPLFCATLTVLSLLFLGLGADSIVHSPAHFSGVSYSLLFNPGIPAGRYRNSNDEVTFESKFPFKVVFPSDTRDTLESRFGEWNLPGDSSYQWFTRGSVDSSKTGDPFLFGTRPYQKVLFYSNKRGDIYTAQWDTLLLCTTDWIYPVSQGDTLTLVSDQPYSYLLGQKQEFNREGETRLWLYEKETESPIFLHINGSGGINQKLIISGLYSTRQQTCYRIAAATYFIAYLIFSILVVMGVRRYKLIKEGFDSTPQQAPGLEAGESPSEPDPDEKPPEHDQYLAQDTPTDYGRTRRHHNNTPKIQDPIMDIEPAIVPTLENELDLFVSQLGNPLPARSILDHYKTTKQMLRATQRVDKLTEVMVAVIDFMKTKTNLMTTTNLLTAERIRSQYLPLNVQLEEELKIATKQADIAEQNKRKVQSEADIKNILNPPAFPPRPKPKTEAEEQEENAKKLARQEEQKRIWREQLSQDPTFPKEDIPNEIERRCRAMGWLDNIT